jgi:hypothetical protein
MACRGTALLFFLLTPNYKQHILSTAEVSWALCHICLFEFIRVKEGVTFMEQCKGGASYKSLWTPDLTVRSFETDVTYEAILTSLTFTFTVYSKSCFFSVALQALTNLGRLSSRRWQSFPTAPDGTGLTCGQHIESHSCIFSFPNRTVTSLFK